ncbi:hypothetical protein Efla_007586 [Eimeria flavescens]
MKACSAAALFFCFSICLECSSANGISLSPPSPPPPEDEGKGVASAPAANANFVDRTCSPLASALSYKQQYYEQLTQEGSSCTGGQCARRGRLLRRLRLLAHQMHHWNREREGTYKGTKFIVFMRHAESAANKAKKTVTGIMRYTWAKLRGRDWGHPDPGLSAEGIQQCMRASAQLLLLRELLRELEVPQGGESPFCFQAFLVSPLKRTLQTAGLTMHGTDKELHCSFSRGQGGSPQRPTWLADAMLREKACNPEDTGTLTSALPALLHQMYADSLLLPTVINLEALRKEKWWLPNDVQALQQILRRGRPQRALEAPGAVNRGFVGDSGEDLGAPSRAPEGVPGGGVPEGAVEGAVGVAPPLPAGGGVGIVTIGDAVAVAPSSAEASVKRTINRIEAPLNEHQEEEAREEPSRRRRVQKETWQQVQLRGKVFLKILCEAEEASTFFVVTHSYFLKRLVGDPIFQNAEFKAFVLRCTNGPSLDVPTTGEGDTSRPTGHSAARLPRRRT